MDPDANVEEQNRILERQRNGRSMCGDEERLEELKEALQGWLRGGGFKPSVALVK